LAKFLYFIVNIIYMKKSFTTDWLVKVMLIVCTVYFIEKIEYNPDMVWL